MKKRCRKSPARDMATNDAMLEPASVFKSITEGFGLEKMWKKTGWGYWLKQKFMDFNF